MKKAILLILITAFTVAFLSGTALSVTKNYRYTDEKGVVHFTDSKEEIPNKYQDSAVEKVEKKRPLISRIIAKAKGIKNKLINFLDTSTSNIFSLLATLCIGIIVFYVLARIFIERKFVRHVVFLFSIAFLSLILLLFYLRNSTDDKGDIRESLNKTNSLIALHKDFIGIS